MTLHRRFWAAVLSLQNWTNVINVQYRRILPGKHLPQNDRIFIVRFQHPDKVVRKHTGPAGTHQCAFPPAARLYLDVGNGGTSIQRQLVRFLGAVVVLYDGTDCKWEKINDTVRLIFDCATWDGGMYWRRFSGEDIFSLHYDNVMPKMI